MTDKIPSSIIELRLPFAWFRVWRADASLHERELEMKLSAHLEESRRTSDIIHNVVKTVGLILGAPSKCDGDHAAPPCTDPQCWRKPPPGCSCYEADPECPRHGKTEP